MKGDFTRLTFERRKHFSQVLRQQGRVTVDADDNEQTAILLHQLRTMARDLMGPYATPAGGGFEAAVDDTDLVVSPGRMYVDGILVENEEPYVVDPALLENLDANADATNWLYLDVWERHVTYIEDDSIREKALGGPDTSTRAQVTWQVRSAPMPQLFEERRQLLQQLDPDGSSAEIQAQLQALTKAETAITNDLDTFRSGPNAKSPLCIAPGVLLDGLGSAHLGARLDPGAVAPDPCVIAPDAKYRGLENQLYRVEIHRGGIAGDAAPPTFKWSRDNGSVVSPWLGTDGDDLHVAHGRGFTAGCWVELVDDVRELSGVPGTLAKVTKVHGNRLTIDPASLPVDPVTWSAQLVNPRVRRWDQSQRGDIVLDEGAVPVVESGPLGTTPAWLDLEDGLQIMFTPGGEYRTGDYWLIPARVATGTIEWPDGMAMPPHGVEHHYAPLGFVWKEGEDLVFGGCRCEFTPASPCGAAFETAGPPPAPIDLRAKPTVLRGPAPASARSVPKRRRKGGGR